MKKENSVFLSRCPGYSPDFKPHYVFKEHRGVGLLRWIGLCMSHSKAYLLLTTHCVSGESPLASSHSTVQYHYTLCYSFHPLISRPVSFFINYKVPKREQQAGIWCWASNLSLRGSDVQLMRIQPEKHPLPWLKSSNWEAGAVTLPPLVLVGETDSYCHNIFTSSCSAPLSNKLLFWCFTVVFCFYYGNILGFTECMCSQCLSHQAMKFHRLF